MSLPSVPCYLVQRPLPETPNRKTVVVSTVLHISRKGKEPKTPFSCVLLPEGLECRVKDSRPGRNPGEILLSCKGVPRKAFKRGSALVPYSSGFTMADSGIGLWLDPKPSGTYRMSGGLFKEFKGFTENPVIAEVKTSGNLFHFKLNTPFPMRPGAIYEFGGEALVLMEGASKRSLERVRAALGPLVKDPGWEDLVRVGLEVRGYSSVLGREPPSGFGAIDVSGILVTEALYADVEKALLVASAKPEGVSPKTFEYPLPVFLKHALFEFVHAKGGIEKFGESYYPNGIEKETLLSPGARSLLAKVKDRGIQGFPYGEAKKAGAQTVMASLEKFGFVTLVARKRYLTPRYIAEIRSKAGAIRKANPSAGLKELKDELMVPREILHALLHEPEPEHDLETREFPATPLPPRRRKPTPKLRTT